MIGATLFSGFEGVGIGMKAAGIKHAWGLEYNADIAAVAQMNGFNTIVADILNCNPADFPDIDYLHASTLCKSGSKGNAHSNGETKNDILTARSVGSFIKILEPSFFTLENVWGYRTYESFQIILDQLASSGYFYHFEHVDMSAFGVPQSRWRLILRASRVGLLRPLIGGGVVGWGEVIKGGCRKSDLTPAQWEAVEGLPHPLLIETQNRHPGSNPFTIRQPHEPAMTVTASGYGRIKVVNGSVTSLGINEVVALQTFPAWYKLPSNNKLAQTGIGNAVPPRFAQRLFESLL